MKKTTFIIFGIFIGISLIILAAQTNAAQVLNFRQGGTGTSTIQANNVFFGSSGGQFFTQDGNFSYATTTDVLTITNASTTNLTISGWLNSSSDRVPNAYFTDLNSTTATIGTLTLTTMASGDLLVNGQGKFGTTATTTISGNNGTSAFSGNLTVNSTTATSTFSTGGLTVGTSQFVVQQTSGNLGIGTTSPYAKLSVAGRGVFDQDVRFDYFTATSTSATSTIAGGLAIETSGLVYDWQTNNVGIGTAGPGALLHTAGNAIFGVGAAAGTDYNVDIRSGSFGGAQGILSFKFGAALTEQAKIDVDVDNGMTLGNVANQNLHVITNNLERMTILAGGNVGIGTTSPARKLTIYDASVPRIAVDSPASAEPGYEFYNAGVLSSMIYRPTNTNDMRLWLAGDKVTILSTGNVGIGTTTPTTVLQATASTANATSTVTIGKTGQNKGSCLELFDAAGTAVYAYIAAGASAFTLSAVSCK